jgi:preprotein translocase subunit SecA
MSLYETWVQQAYDREGKANDKHWDKYMPREQKLYESMLENKTDKISGTVKQLSERYDMPVEFMCGFIDGINEAIATPVDIEALEETTEVELAIDFEKLFRKMVEYKAEHLYSLPQWDNIFSQDRQKELYTEQKRSTTFTRKEEKIGRNDPCPCGSGKKYKKCCGANA